MRHFLFLSLLTTVIVAGARSQPGHAQAHTGSFEVRERSIADIHSALRAGQVTCRDIVTQYLARIDSYNRQGPNINAVQSVNPAALAEADRLDGAMRTGGMVGPLHCVTVLVKDQIETHDMPTTYGSAAFKDFTPTRDATVVTKLRAAGAVIIGKATMGEFASGYAGSVSGPIRNPYDPRRHPSGSSGGTGAGIAANFATVGIGEDTGGSVRGPASAGSLVGHRPTLPLVSRYGMMPFRPNYDTIGPITRTVRDAAAVLDVLASYDKNDPVTAYAVGHIPSSYAANLQPNALRGVRLGVVRQPMSATTDPSSADYRNVHTVLDAALAEVQNLGTQLIDVTIPDVAGRVSRAYDGDVFEPEAAIDGYLAQHPNAPYKTLREILLSGKVLPWRANGLMGVIGHTTQEAGFADLQRQLEDTRRLVLGLMAQHDVTALIYATGDHSPSLVAPDVMTNPKEGDTRVGGNRTLASVLAFPAITVPAGFTSEGMPVGLEFMGRAFDDATLLQLAFSYEQATHHREPPGATP